MPVKKMGFLPRSSSNSKITVKKNSPTYLLVVKKKKRRIAVTMRKQLCSWTKNMYKVKRYLFPRLPLFVRLMPLYFHSTHPKRKIFLSFKNGRIHRRSGKAAETYWFNTAYFAYKRVHWYILCVEFHVRSQVFMINCLYEILSFLDAPTFVCIHRSSSIKRHCFTPRFDEEFSFRKC